MNNRPDRQTYFLNIALMVAERSTCTRAKVGAVLVSNKRIIATGYNGSPPGANHCIDVGCLMDKGHCIRTIHAELNAVLNMEHEYEHITLYCTHQPCWECFKALYALGTVDQINYLVPYADQRRDAGVLDLGFPSKCNMVRVPWEGLADVGSLSI